MLITDCYADCNSYCNDFKNTINLLSFLLLVTLIFRGTIVIKFNRHLVLLQCYIIDTCI